MNTTDLSQSSIFEQTSGLSAFDNDKIRRTNENCERSITRSLSLLFLLPETEDSTSRAIIDPRSPNTRRLLTGEELSKIVSEVISTPQLERTRSDKNIGPPMKPIAANWRILSTAGSKKTQPRALCNWLPIASIRGYFSFFHEHFSERPNAGAMAASKHRDRRAIAMPRRSRGADTAVISLVRFAPRRTNPFPPTSDARHGAARPDLPDDRRVEGRTSCHARWRANVRGVRAFGILWMKL